MSMPSTRSRTRNNSPSGVQVPTSIFPAERNLRSSVAGVGVGVGAVVGETVSPGWTGFSRSRLSLPFPSCFEVGEGETSAALPGVDEPSGVDEGVVVDLAVGANLGVETGEVVAPAVDVALGETDGLNGIT